MTTPLCVREAEAEGVALEPFRSLELRWIREGTPPRQLDERFARVPFRTEHRRDLYLVTPKLRHLSIKIRGGESLDVKVRQGAPVLREGPGWQGLSCAWEKWAFPLVEVSADPGSRAWRAVDKFRRITEFDPSISEFSAAVPTSAEARCSIELTRIGIPAGSWWTLGFEASGPEDVMLHALASAAGQFLPDAFDEDAHLSGFSSESYAEWLARPTIWSAAPRSDQRRRS